MPSWQEAWATSLRVALDLRGRWWKGNRRLFIGLKGSSGHIARAEFRQLGMAGQEAPNSYLYPHAFSWWFRSPLQPQAYRFHAIRRVNAMRVAIPQKRRQEVVTGTPRGLLLCLGRLNSGTRGYNFYFWYTVKSLSAYSSVKGFDLRKWGLGTSRKHAGGEECAEVNLGPWERQRESQSAINEGEDSLDNEKLHPVPGGEEEDEDVHDRKYFNDDKCIHSKRAREMKTQRVLSPHRPAPSNRNTDHDQSGNCGRRIVRVLSMTVRANPSAFPGKQPRRASGGRSRTVSGALGQSCGIKERKSPTGNGFYEPLEVIKGDDIDCLFPSRGTRGVVYQVMSCTSDWGPGARCYLRSIPGLLGRKLSGTSQASAGYISLGHPYLSFWRKGTRIAYPTTFRLRDLRSH